MTDIALTGARILTDDGWRDDHALILSDGRIAAIVPVAATPARAQIEHLRGGALLPGFIDTQVNGGGGILFNDAPTVAGITAIAATHRRFGTTALLPTLISDDLAVIARAIAAVDDAIAAGVPGVIGLHIEGPFLNSAKRGIHDAAKFRRIDDAAVAQISALKNGVTLVTLAPECAPPGAIAALVANGVVVAAGHSMASYDDMQRARAEGLSAVTHLFNAMTGLESRAPGIVGAAMEARLPSGIIVDGQHVHPAALRVALAAMGPDALMLVTDAMPTVGAAERTFMLGEQRITAQGGACRAADGTLAGSDLDMAAAVRNSMAMMAIDLPTASRMASRTAAMLLGMGAQRGTLARGMAADIVHLDPDHRVTATWIGGDRG